MNSEVQTMKTVPMFKRIVIAGAAAALAIFSLVPMGRLATADPLNEPVAKMTASEILRTYPMPGDQHDAVASFEELAGVGRRSENASVLALVLRAFPLPGDQHDAAFSFEEIVTAATEGAIDLGAIQVAPAIAPRTPASVIPMPGDQHDAAAQLAEFYGQFSQGVYRAEELH